MKSGYQLESYAKSDIGLVRGNNEDSFRELENEKFFILADGMGGHKAGEIASSKAVDYMCRSVQNFFINTQHLPKIEELKNHVAKFIENTNLWVHHLSAQEPKYQGMGTTLCSILFFEKSIIYSHVGDSRIYRFREGSLQQLTDDHLAIRHRKGILTTRQSTNEVSYTRRVLTRAIGTSLEVVPDVVKEIAKRGDIYLMCSDGLTDHVSNEAIAGILASNESLQQIGDSLIEKAKQGGGQDNITLVLVRII